MVLVAILLCVGVASGTLAAAAPVLPAHAAVAPCTAAGECTDNEGTVWDLSMLGRIHRVGGTYNAGSGPRPDTFTYAFRLYANLGVVPEICTSSGVETASAMRYQAFTVPGGDPPSCEQIGPDMVEGDPIYTVRRVPMGLTFSYQLAGVDSVEINLRCHPEAGVGQPSDAFLDDQQQPGTPRVYVINWFNGITCPGVVSPCTPGGVCVDDAGTAWDLARIGQIQRVAGPIPGNATLRVRTSFDICQIPTQICRGNRSAVQLKLNLACLLCDQVPRMPFGSSTTSTSSPTPALLQASRQPAPCAMI